MLFSYKCKRSKRQPKMMMLFNDWNYGRASSFHHRNQISPSLPIFYIPDPVEMSCYTCCKPANKSPVKQPWDAGIWPPKPKPPRKPEDHFWVVTFPTQRPVRPPTTEKPWYPAPTRTTRKPWTTRSTRRPWTTRSTRRPWTTRSTTRRPATWKPTEPWSNDHTWVVTTKRTTTEKPAVDVDDIEIVDAREDHFSKFMQNRV